MPIIESVSSLFSLTVILYWCTVQTLSFPFVTTNIIIPTTITQSITLHHKHHHQSLPLSTSSYTTTSTSSTTTTALNAATLKPAAQPLLTSGKALAVSGEALIDLTDKIDLWGGGLSAVGANIRNGGDCIAQAAASCRFKTGMELVCDELREGATCLEAAVAKGKDAVEEAERAGDEGLRGRLAELVPDLAGASFHLEAAGEGVMKRISLIKIGTSLYEAGVHLEGAALTIGTLVPDQEDGKLSSMKMVFAAGKMKEAGESLRDTGTSEGKTGGNWLKAGGL